MPFLPIPAVQALTITATGIASAEAFGTASVVEQIAGTGIASAEAFGGAAVGALVAPGGIASAEAFGTASVKLAIAPSAIASAEAFGTPSQRFNLLNGLLAYWSLDEASGDAIDAHASFDLTDTNTVGAGTGKVSGARDFDAASSEYFSGGDVLDFEKDAPRTVAFWIHPSDISAARELVSKKDASAENGWAVFAAPAASQGPALQLRGAGGRDLIVRSNTALSTSGLTHVAITFDGTYTSGSSVTIYLDGSAVGTTTDEAALQAGDTNLNAGSLVVGARSQTSPTNFFDGLLDELAIWDRVLSAGEVSYLYNGGNGRSYADLSDQTIEVDGLASAEVFGTLTTNQQVGPIAIASGEAFGATSVQSALAAPTAIPSEEAFGTPAAVQSAAPVAIGSGEAFGAPVVTTAQTIQPASGIPSGAAFGLPALTQQIALQGMTSEEIFGTAAIVPQQVLATAITSAEAFGSPQLNQVLHAGTAIDSSEAFGTPIVGALITPSAIASGEAFGTASVVASLAPAGIASAEAFGTANVSTPLGPAAIASAEAFGSASLTLRVSTEGIASGETFGTAAAEHQIGPPAIGSGEAFGTLAAQLQLNPPGLASAEEFAAELRLDLQLRASGIGTGEALGSPVVDATTFLHPAGVATVQAFGVATVKQQLAAGADRVYVRRAREYVVC